MTNLNYQIVEKSIILDGQKLDAMAVNEYWIPIKKNQIIETDLLDGYRCVVVNGVHYQFHRSIHEVGRPHLLNEILDLMKVINEASI